MRIDGCKVIFSQCSFHPKCLGSQQGTDPILVSFRERECELLIPFDATHNSARALEQKLTKGIFLN